MLTAVPGQRPSALAPAEPSPKADGVLLLLARLPLINMTEQFLSTWPALDPGMCLVCLNPR